MARPGESRDRKALISIVYRSLASSVVADADLLRLLARARAQNALLDVTGVLVHDRGRFFQCIEGVAESLDLVMHRIRRDPRHAQIRVLSRQEVPSRLYPGWPLNLARRRNQSPLVAEGLILAEAKVLDGLHLNDLGIQLSLASLSMTWESEQPSIV